MQPAGVVEGKDSELEALRERLAEAKAVATGKSVELAEAQQLFADRHATSDPRQMLSLVSPGHMT